MKTDVEVVRRFAVFALVATTLVYALGLTAFIDEAASASTSVLLVVGSVAGGFLVGHVAARAARQRLTPRQRLLTIAASQMAALAGFIGLALTQVQWLAYAAVAITALLLGLAWQPSVKGGTDSA